MGWELWGFFGVEGLDTRICWSFCGVRERKKDLGLNPTDSIGLIQGDEAHCSLRKDKGRGGEQATAKSKATAKANTEILATPE